MIERKLHYELVSRLKEGGRLPALVYVKNGFDLYFAERNFKIIKRYPIVNAVGVNLDFNSAMKLSSVEGVDYIAAESKVSTLDDINDVEKISLAEAIKRQSAIRPVFTHSKKVSTESLSIPPDMDGKGVGLCVLDTGVMPHLDLWFPSVKLACFKDVLNEKETPYDDNGHGTFVAGVALGSGIMSAKKVSGFASGANLFRRNAVDTRQQKKAENRRCVYVFRRRTRSARPSLYRSRNACKKRYMRGGCVGKQRKRQRKIACRQSLRHFRRSGRRRL